MIIKKVLHCEFLVEVGIKGGFLYLCFIIFLVALDIFPLRKDGDHNIRI